MWALGMPLGTVILLEYRLVLVLLGSTADLPVCIDLKH